MAVLVALGVSFWFRFLPLSAYGSRPMRLTFPTFASSFPLGTLISVGFLIRGLQVQFLPRLPAFKDLEWPVGNYEAPL